MILDKLVENLNFDEKEAKVYLAALELGESRVSEIAQKAKINRITTYEILKRFRYRGIAASTSNKNVIMFRVLDPEMLVEKMERQLFSSKEMLPQLLALKGGNKNRPKIEYYDGVEGIRSIYTDTLYCKEKTIYNIASPEDLLKTIGEDFFENYLKRRVSRNIKVKVLIPRRERNKKYIKESSEKLREVRFFDQDKYQIPNELMIYDDKLILLSFSSKIGVVIEDIEIAKSMKALWNLVWDLSGLK